SRNIRISEFMEKFDKLNHGIISKSEFCRALDSSNIKLNSNQLASIFTTQRRLDLVPMFKDFDVNNVGSISRPQFDRSLSLLGLSPILCRDTQEIVQKMFGKKVGGREDIDYVGFCEKINQLAGFCPT
ncbi:uncharacterized protein LOC115227718, partial [Octopus sinensis]|uniref:Uncharacterized protein LOC115227718 n=1 Tax=Octopus sinensis TaxID=2607531 RepID=A0A7E6EH81_9MOLL